MRLLVELFRVMLISIEALFLLMIIGVVTTKSDWFASLGSVIKRQPDVVRWLPVLPLALCTMASQWAWKLTTPIEKSNRELVEWPAYWRLKVRRNWSLCLSVAAAFVAVVLWIFASEISDMRVGVLTVASIGVAGINAGCMFFATLTIREILEK